jgi:hypothetical protein
MKSDKHEHKPGTLTGRVAWQQGEAVDEEVEEDSISSSRCWVCSCCRVPSIEFDQRRIDDMQHLSPSLAKCYNGRMQVSNVPDPSLG